MNSRGQLDAQYTTGDHQRNDSRKNEEMGSKQNLHLLVNVTGDRGKKSNAVRNNIAQEAGMSGP